jgi:TRAP-type mannitol/chloroaromatic compound transport system permease small subunit
MQSFFLAVDRLSTRVGQLFSWTVAILTIVICWEVFSRYFLGKPNSWILDAQIMLYGIMFMMAGAYTLSKNGHVRGDVLYGFFTPRTQASLDLVLYFVFFIPGVLALAWAGWDFANDSFRLREHSSISADGPPIYPFKAMIPLAGGLLLLQGIVEILRCIVCIKDGKWPSREQDVEEVDVDKLKAMVGMSGVDTSVDPMNNKKAGA